MYCSGFNSAFVEERPDSVPSHSSGSVSSLPRGHHTCRLLHKQLTHSSGGAHVSQRGEVWKSRGEQRYTEKRKTGIRGGRRKGRGVLDDRWKRGNEGSGGWRKVEEVAFYTRMVPGWVEGRTEHMSAQGKEKRHHV